jgi:hypothetical protein
MGVIVAHLLRGKEVNSEHISLFGILLVYTIPLIILTMPDHFGEAHHRRMFGWETRFCWVVSEVRSCTVIIRHLNHLRILIIDSSGLVVGYFVCISEKKKGCDP